MGDCFLEERHSRQREQEVQRSDGRSLLGQEPGCWSRQVEGKTQVEEEEPVRTGRDQIP